MDISIKNLDTYVFEPKSASLRLTRAREITGTLLTVTEKIDGTKLTLVRTDNFDLNDYTKNWIVSYKGTVLYSTEFSHYGEAERENVKKYSTGIGQYVLVFDHLKSINGSIVNIPANTEFSIEFAQNKATLTRTYESFGAMFLRSYAPVGYRIVNGDLLTWPTAPEITDITAVGIMANTLRIETFHTYFTGKLSLEYVAGNKLLSGLIAKVNWSDPFDIIQNVNATLLASPSKLGGKIEGVVFTLESGKLFKVVQSDQYDAAVREAKKNKFGDYPHEMTEYFREMRKLISRVVVDLNMSESENYILGIANRTLSKISFSQFPINTRKTETQIREDAHETLRLVVGKMRLLNGASNSVGLVPIAGKPVHIGHWKLIEAAARENDRVVVYTTFKDRNEPGEFPIKGSDFVYFWHDFFIPKLPANVIVKFVDSPVRAILHEIGWFEQSTTQDGAPVPIVNLYSDASDILTNFKDTDLSKYPTIFASGKLNRVGINRNNTVNISGTKMREFLQTRDKTSFFNHLPPISGDAKFSVWNILQQNASTGNPGNS